MIYTEKIFDVSTGQTIVRELEPAEIIKIEEDKNDAETRLKEIENRELARKAVLAKLGLTEEEAKLLLS